LRWAVVAGKPGPDSLETMRIFGWEETRRRMAAAEDVLKGLKSESVD
jgi:glutamyl-tRNA synthetase